MSLKASKQSVNNEAANFSCWESQPCAEAFSTTALSGWRPTTPTGLELMTMTWILSPTCAWDKTSLLVMWLPCAFTESRNPNTFKVVGNRGMPFSSVMLRLPKRPCKVL